LQNAADDEDVVSLDTDEEQKQQDTEDDHQHRDTYEDSGRAERCSQDTVEVRETSVADSVSTKVNELTEFVQSDIANLAGNQSTDLIFLTWPKAQNPLDMFVRNFSVNGEVTNLLSTSHCNGI